MIVWWGPAAWAAEPGSSCPDLGAEIAAAWASFDDAEHEAADAALTRAQASLTCQTEVVPTEQLLELYRLDGLIALSRGDREDAVFATIRAVTIQPEGTPPANYGPELAEFTATWRARLSQRTAMVYATDTASAWVDGVVIPDRGALAVVPGEHLLQWLDDNGFHSGVHDVAQEWTIQGVPPTVLHNPELPPPKDPVEKDPRPTREPKVKPPKDPTEPASSRGTSGVLIGTGAVFTGAGIGLASVAFNQETRFHNEAWDATQYGPCDLADPCYDNAREQEIRQSANTIRGLYGAGYGLMALGVASLGGGLFLVEDARGIPSGLGATVRW